MALADDLGNLILRLNPYTNRDIPDSDPPLVAGGMDPYLNSPSRGKTPPISARLRWNWTARQEWTFKGEPQKVGMAYRIKYRFPVYQQPAQGQQPQPLYWLEDYVLIGFEGGMGG